MTRPRTETIGSLGRTPARTDKLPKTPLPLPTTPLPPSRQPGDRRTIAQWIHDALFTNIVLKFVSLVLAVTVFLLVNNDSEAERLLTFTIHYALPDDKVLVSPPVTELHVRVKGPQRKIDAIDKSQLDMVEMDLHDESGGEVPIPVDKIELPKGISVASVTPKFVKVAFEKRVEKIVDITPTLSGHPQHGYVIAEVKTTPATVRVRGAETVLRGLASVRTREYSLEGRTEGLTLESQLIAQDGVEIEGSNVVSLQVRIEEQIVHEKVPPIAIVVRAADGIDPAKWRIVPAQLEATLTGTRLVMDKLETPVAPYVEITAADVSAAAQKDGKHELEVRIDGLPAGIDVKLSPDRVRLVQNPAR